MSEAITAGIRVEVMSQHAPEHSNRENGDWVFQYTVRITNQSAETVRLLSRHWIISDALEETREIKGPGVVGKQPVLTPGESFKYSSWSPIKTPTGMMRGSYRMARANGEEFDIQVAPFALRARYTVH